VKELSREAMAVLASAATLIWRISVLRQVVGSNFTVFDYHHDVSQVANFDSRGAVDEDHWS